MFVVCQLFNDKYPIVKSHNTFDEYEYALKYAVEVVMENNPPFSKQQIEKALNTNDFYGEYDWSVSIIYV